MTDRHKNSAPYAASDIEKYLKGELPASEMHALERAALEDPFLADAIEGLTLHTDQASPTTLEQDLAQLHERLASRVKTSRRRFRFLGQPFAAAAALILLLGIAYGFFFFFTHRDTPGSATSLAKSAPVRSIGPASSNPTAPAPPSSNPAAPNTAPRAARSAAPNAEPRARTASSPHDAEPKPSPGPAAATVAKRGFADSNAITGNLSSSVAVASAHDLARQQFLADSVRSSTLDNALVARTADQLTYRGTITDQQNRPIAGATLALTGSDRYTTVTDQNGQFNLSLRPDDTLNLLTISSIGYDKQLLALNTLSTDGLKDNIIRLTPQRSNLDEVVVVGYGAHRKEAKVLAPSDNNERLDSLWTLARPVIGRPAYLRYLDSAKKKLALDSTIRGTETISFLVNRDGTLSAFKIEQSLSPAHDAGILHLVSDGPAWRLLKGKHARAAVTLRF